MKRALSHRLSYANVMATIAVVLALGAGSVYAAGKINGKRIKPNSIPGNRLKPNSVTGRQVNSSTLGTVPNATTATNAGHANVADALSSNGDFQALSLNSGWIDNVEPTGDDSVPVGYYKDREGFVHLRGSVSRTSGTSSLIGTLPAGFRPAGSTSTSGLQLYEVAAAGGAGAATVSIGPNGQIQLVISPVPGMSLNGITFRAGN